MSGTITKEGSNGNGDSRSRKQFMNSKWLFVFPLATLTGDDLLADELNVEEKDPGKLGSSNGPRTSQISRQIVTKDIVPHSPGFQVQTETLLIGPENLEISTHEEAIQEASMSDSLTSSFSHDIWLKSSTI